MSIIMKRASTVQVAQRSRDEEKKIHQALQELNVQVATFRDSLVHVGGTRDGPELREKIRRVRRICLEAVVSTNSALLPHIKLRVSEGNIVDNSHLICLYLLTRLLQRELDKCLRLVSSMPIDMEEYFEAQSRRPVREGIGTMLTQIVLSKTGRPNFNKEEVASVEKDKRELATIVADIADHLPKEDPSKAVHGLASEEINRRKWSLNRKRRKYMMKCCFSCK